jgi:hypothetical protein
MTESGDDGAKELVQGIMDHCFAWLAERRADEARRDGYGPKLPKERAVTPTHP